MSEPNQDPRTGWQARLGTALEALGTSLMSVGAVGGFTEYANVVLWVGLAGFLLKALGAFFTKLWSPVPISDWPMVRAYSSSQGDASSAPKP